MSDQFYSDARLYDRLFPGGDLAVDFYRAEADRHDGRVLELGCGTGNKLIPIASDGHPCMGLELSPEMLAEAQRKADERGVEVEWVQGDMREFDLDRTFDLVFIAANSLLHLHEAEDLVGCFRSVRRHLGAWSAAHLRRVQSKRAHACPGRRRSTQARRVVVRGSRSRRSAGRRRGDLRRGGAGDSRELVLLDRFRGRLRCPAA
jgi:SAM-dependent methyltransferase